MALWWMITTARNDTYIYLPFWLGEVCRVLQTMVKADLLWADEESQILRICHTPYTYMYVEMVKTNVYAMWMCTWTRAGIIPHSVSCFRGTGNF